MTPQDVTIESIDRFLASVSTELESLKHFETLYTPVLAPHFNAVSCSGPDENRLSKIIAMLLDPKGEHGQGRMFLDNFLQMLKEQDLKNELAQQLDILTKHCEDPSTIKKTTRMLEVTTDCLDDQNKQRRIDILLDLNGFGLAVENKPWAEDQPNQISDYLKHLSFKFNSNKATDAVRDYLLVYLSRDGNPPSDYSIQEQDRIGQEKSGHFFTISYGNLKKWCLDCVEKCKAIKVRLFVEDFAAYIKDKFEGGTPAMEKKVIINQAIKKENIAAAVSVGFNWPDISLELFKKLADLSFEAAGLAGGEWERHVDFNIYDKQVGISFSKKNWKKIVIRFAFFSPNTMDFCWGIATDGNKLNCSNLINKKLDENIGKSEPPDDWWPWRLYFEAPLRNWNESTEPWCGISQDGDTVRIVAKKLSKLIEVAGSTIDEYETCMNVNSQLK